MESFKSILKNKNTQYFLIFILFVMTFSFTIYPLLDAAVAQPAIETPVAPINNAQVTNTSSKNQILPADIAFVSSDTPVAIYEQPNKQEIPIAELTKNQYVTTLGKVIDNWIQIQYNQRVAWVEASSVVLSKLLIIADTPSATLYSEASTTSKAITTIPQGSLIYLVQDTNSSFHKVRFGDYEGYIQQEFINYAVDSINENYQKQPTLPQTLNAKKTLVTKFKETPLYDSPNAFGTRIATVADGTIFSYEDRDQDYYKVTYQNNQTAYIPYWLVTTNFASVESDPHLPQGIAHAKIVIDPGHGGDDPGAVVNFSNLHEADHTLTTAQYLKQELEALGATVVLTRTNDTSVSLAERANISNQEQANAFISLHFDSGPNANVSGTTGYFFSANSENLGATIGKYLKQNLPIKNQGILFQNFMVLRENTQPAVLLELGYLNNPEDNKIIETQEYQQNIAKSIANALKEYFQ